jgi:serine/threonine protein kinase
MLSPGTRLGPYEVFSLLGAGGMGEVYRARDAKLEREVALKVLGPDLLADENARKRFRKEALALAKLSHPNIAQVYDFASESGVDFLVMELISGEALSDRLEREPLPESDVLKCGAELADGLAAAHAEGIVHCDIKPANLRLGRDGHLKILDFGLARLRRPAGTAEVTASLSGADVGIAGTIPYMAPEQLRGETLDARTDIWAAGVVLYELSTGARPFRDLVTTRLIDAILHGTPDAPTERRKGLSPSLGHVILKCLEKDPARRYQSAGELRSDLDRPASQGTAQWPATKFRSRLSRRGTTAAVAALAVLAGVITVLTVRHRKPEAGAAGARIASLAVLPLSNMTGDAGQEYFSDGMTEALITELAKIRSLKVISRTSVMRLKKTDKSLPEIAKQLGVEGIVEGSVTRGGGRVRVTAQLIQASTDQHLWADSFDRDAADVLGLQSEIAGAIAGQVRAAVGAEQAVRGTPRRKVKPEAYDLVLQGTHLMTSGGGPEAFKRAISLFEKASVLDPGFARAHAGLANALSSLAGYGFAPFWDSYPRIRKEVDAALALDPDEAWAQLARSQLLWAERDPQGAVEAARRATELDPGNSTALTMYGGQLAALESGPEVERLLRKAIEIDPLAQMPRCNYKDWLYGRRRYAEAEVQARMTLDLDPNWFWAWDQLWRIHLREGKLAQAQDESRKAWTVAFGEGFRPPSGLSWEAYDRWLDGFLEAQPRSFVNGFLAADFARRNEKEKALGYLEKAAAGNETFLGLLDWPEFDSIREGPRFRKIVEERKLPVAIYCKLPPREKKL